MIGRILPIFLFGLSTVHAFAGTPMIAGYDRFADQQPIQAGRVLLTELSCTACHNADQDQLKPKRGPDLDGVAFRLQSDWVREFLASPETTKPGTTMPNMFVGWPADEKQNAISALTAFLATQRKPLPELISTAGNPIAPLFWSKGDTERGRQLYHQVGCVACHEPDAKQQATVPSQTSVDAETMEELGIAPPPPVKSVPHSDLPKKYAAQSLTHFLLDPLATRSSGRMPNLKLKPDEAADIAAYLLGGPASDSIVSPIDYGAELVEKGRTLFKNLRCVNCHLVGPVSSLDMAAPFSDLNTASATGCIARARKGLPNYSVNDSQRSAIVQAIANPQVDQPVVHRMTQLNCYACHERSGRGGVGPNRRGFFETVEHVDLGDEGRIPPPLDGVGKKLNAQWMTNVLAGQGDVRPFLRTRMPIFGDSAMPLVSEFLVDQRTDSVSDPGDINGVDAEVVDTEVVDTEVGRKLLGTGCIQCHPINGEHLPGVVGVDLAHIDKRLRSPWFRDFVLDPAALKNRTRMPAFFRNGKSPNPELAEGNVRVQIASMWRYLSEVEKHPLPDKIQQGRAHNFELIPQQKPIVLRTFMDQAGPHAIAVGFPEGVHLAFDAESVRVAQFWRGKFLDAHGTWFDRFTPPAKPLGSNLVNLSGPSDPTNLSDRTFRGYRLDDGGIPTFLYRIDNVDIEDRYTPTDKKGFRRTLRLSLADGQSGPVAVSLPSIAGTNLKRQSNREYRNEQGLTVRWMTDKGPTEWSIPVEVARPTEVVLEYQW